MPADHPTLEESTKSSFDIKPLQGDFGYVASNSIYDIAELWKSLQPADNIFIGYDYLKIAEDYPPQGSMFYYVVIFKKGQPHGFYYFQQGTFRASDSDNTDSNFRSKEKSWSRGIQAQLSKMINVETLIMGNILQTGENAYHFPHCTDCKCSTDLNLVNKVIDLACESFKKRGKKIGLLFLKDFYPESTFEDNACLSDGYVKTTFEPSMEMDIPTEWNEYADYLAAVRSKYRVKFKKVNKKLEPIRRRELNLEQIIENSEQIFNFYLAIQQKAGFNLVQLHPQYFEACKRTYGDRFQLFGLYEGDEMIAFHSFFVLEHGLDAHWLGYTESKNKQYELYFNMLLLAVKMAIDLKKPRILFARTAMEIKSSVGAVPKDMYVYLKHRKSLYNKAIPKIATFLKGNENWEQRKPFKS